LLEQNFSQATPFPSPRLLCQSTDGQVGVQKVKLCKTLILVKFSCCLFGDIFVLYLLVNTDAYCVTGKNY